MASKKMQEEKRRATRLRQKAQHEVPEEELNDEIEDEVQEEAKPVKKEYGESISFAGPTSWSELDALKDAREKAEAVREVTWQVQDLVSNILYSALPVKTKAKAIQSVGDGFAERLYVAEKGDAMEKSIESLELEAMIAKDLRHISIVEKVGDWISKMKLTATAEEKLSDSDFALPEQRKYPIYDKAHVRSSLFSVAQIIKDGGEESEDAKKALPQIRAVAKEMGIGVVGKEQNSIAIEKGADGEWRWVGWVSNNFADHSGDILTESAHLEYVDWVNKDLDRRAPVFTSCHAPGTVRDNQVDFIAYENGFLVMSGKLTEAEAEQLFTVSKEFDLGMSHTAWGLRDENDKRQVVKYRIFEVTDLPVSEAANPFTTLETISKEADMNQKQLDYLTKLLGSKERAEEVLNLKTSLAQKELTDAGVESKEKPAETPAITEAPVPTAVTINLDVETVFKEVLSRVSKELDVEGLSAYLVELQATAEKVPVLEALVKELATDKADKLAEMIEPPAAKTLVWQKARASQSTETILTESKEDETLKKSKPEMGWLSQATGTAPVDTK